MHSFLKMADTIGKRVAKKNATQEDINHLLEEIWEFEPEDAFCKAFTRETKMRIHCILAKSRAQLLEITCREDDDNVAKIQDDKVGDICMLVHC